MWDANHDDDVEEELESLSDVNKSWAVGMIIPVLVSLLFITLTVLSK